MMNCFIAVFKFEGKRLLNRTSLVILLVLLVFVLGFFLNNISEYKAIEEQKKSFQDLETKKVDQFLNYRVYGARGFLLFFLPDPKSVFFINSVPIPDMNAYVDSAEQLKFSKPINIKTVFELRKNWFTDYSGILLLIGTLLILFYGYPALKSTEYNRLPDSITGHKNFFWAVYFARGLWLLVFLIAFLACLILLAALNGIMIAIDQYLLTFLLVSYGLAMLIFSVGFWCGTWKSAAKGMVTALLIWVVFIFFIPTLLNFIIVGNVNTMPPAYKFEMDKLVIYMDWEKDLREKEGIVKPGEKPSEGFKKRMLEYKDNELKKLQAMEEEQIVQLNRTKTFYQFISSFFPTTFYQSVNNEISSRGFDNMIDFCKYSLDMKLKFIAMIIEKEYFSNYSKVEKFTADNTDVFTAKPKIPEFFLLGILFNLLWIAAFVIPAYYGYKKRLAELPEKKKDEIEPKDVKVEEANIVSWRTYKPSFSTIVYNLLSNQIQEVIKKGYQFNMTLFGQLLNTAKKGVQFLYLCPPWEIPGHFVTGHFVDLLMDLMKVDKTRRKEIKTRFSLDSFKKKKISQLETTELGQVYLAILEMKTFPIYLIDDVPKGMLLDFCTALKQKMFDLYQDGSTIFFLSSEANYYHPRRRDHVKIADETLAWFKKINALLDEKEEEEMDNEETDEDKAEIFLK